MSSMASGRKPQTIKERPYNDTLKNKIIARRMWHNESFEDIGDAVGCSMEYAWTVWAEYNGNSQFKKDSFDDLCEDHQRVIKHHVEHPEWSRRKIGEEVGIAASTVNRVINNNPHLIEELEAQGNQ